jgi:hypothetical protein
MSPLRIDRDLVTIEFSKEELGVICNALNEVCSGIEVWEFETRMSVTVENARSILSALVDLYQQTARAATDEDE